ncbi:LysR family transcriptional regulator [Phenylobacterium sp.]|uniref:LysR family transcriptional regulator n=1 Tax=Phenylobacterium sp. TaxID=1871053 RepID=UPI00289C7EFA|nr:LysR family transcriptional regulator [Phenylobacterium sp.]
MDLQHIRTFVTIASEGSIQAAARRLGVAQPPLSRQLRRLEDECGELLFDRSRRGVTLTAAGRALLDRARQILVDFDDLAKFARNVGDGTQGELAVSFDGSAVFDVVTQAISTFSNQYPGVRVAIADIATDDQWPALDEGRVQAGFVFLPQGSPGHLAHRPVHTSKMMIAIDQYHRLAAAASIQPADLAGERIIMNDCRVSRALVEAAIVQIPRPGNAPVIEGGIGRLHVMLGLVAAGHGIAILPEALRVIHRDGVVYRDAGPDFPELTLSIAWNPAVRHPARDRFLAHLQGASPPPAPRRAAARAGMGRDLTPET